MSELAFNYKGRRFLLPKEAVFWSVERLRDDQRGQLDVVRGPDGLPLILPITTSIDEFHTQNEDRPGRYKLTPLDESKMELEGVPAAYVTVPPERRPAEVLESPRRDVHVGTRSVRSESMVTAPFGTWSALPMPLAMSGAEYLLGEALRGHVQMFQMLTAALSDRNASNANGASQMMVAAAELVRAADGAAMPNRQPVTLLSPANLLSAGISSPPPDPRNAAGATSNGLDDDSDEDMDAAPKSDDQDELESLMGKFGSAIAAVSPAIPHLVTLVRGYPPTATAVTEGLRNAGLDDLECDPETENTTASLTVTPAMWSHMRVIYQELGDDGSLFRRAYQALSRDRRSEILDQLCSMDIDDAVDAAAAMIAPCKMRLARRERMRHTEISSTNGNDSLPTSNDSFARNDSFSLTHAPDPVDNEPAISSCADPNHAGEVDLDHQDHADLAFSDQEAEENNHDLTQENNLAERTNPTTEPKHRPNSVLSASDTDSNDATSNNASGAIGSDNDRGTTLVDRAPCARTTKRETTARNVTVAKRTTGKPTPTPTKGVNAESHMLKIGKHLTITEMLQAKVLIAAMSATERADWILRLAPLAPVEAAKIVRTELARRT